MKYRILAAALTLSAAGLIGIAVHENYRGTAYKPTPRDVPTIGFGHTQGVRSGDSTTPVRALVILRGDVSAVEEDLHAPSCLGGVPLYPNEWDAYVSLAYNIGPHAFCHSTLVTMLRRTPPDYTGACRQILRWNRQAGRVLPGLVKRREAEYRQCAGVAP